MKMIELEKRYRRTMFWKAKLEVVNDNLRDRYQRKPNQRVEMYEDYVAQQKKAMKCLDEKQRDCQEFRAKSMRGVIG